MKDQDKGQFGRDASKHLRTADQAAMKRTAMDVKPGQMPGMVGDASSQAPTTPVEREQSGKAAESGYNAGEKSAPTGQASRGAARSQASKMAARQIAQHKAGHLN